MMTDQDGPLEISPVQLAARIAGGDSLVVLDVREPWEFDVSSLPNSTLVPLATLTGAITRLDASAEYVVLCHHGMRSDMAAKWMRSQGFARVLNLTGGINAYRLTVDHTIPRY